MSRAKPAGRHETSKTNLPADPGAEESPVRMRALCAQWSAGSPADHSSSRAGATSPDRPSKEATFRPAPAPSWQRPTGSLMFCRNPSCDRCSRMIAHPDWAKAKRKMRFPLV